MDLFFGHLYSIPVVTISEKNANPWERVTEPLRSNHYTRCSTERPLLTQEAPTVRASGKHHSRIACALESGIALELDQRTVFAWVQTVCKVLRHIVPGNDFDSKSRGCVAS